MIWDITTYLCLAVYAYTIITTIVMLLMENRNPVKSIAWIIVLVLVPIVGFVFYLFFGRNFRKKMVISRRSLEKKKGHKEIGRMSNMGYTDDANFPEEYKNMALMAYNSCDATLYSKNSIRLYTDGITLYDRIFADIKEAKDHIHLDYYIFCSDLIGTRMIESLVEKAKQGVEVRVIIDDVGSWTMSKSSIRQMKKAGVEVMEFLRVGLPFLNSKVNYRNHRKILVIDGKIGYTGGMNIADRYISGLDWGQWRDTHVRIEGEAVHGLQRIFFSDWYFVTRKFLSDSSYFPVPDVSGESLAQVVSSGPDTQWDSIMQFYFMAITQAKKYVYIQTPYFLPNDSIITALQTMALGGVDVRIMLPLRADANFTLMSSFSYMEEMLRCGIKVYLYNNGFIHSKVIVIDDKMATVGSANMDFRSFEQNFEVNIAMYDPAVALKMRSIFENDSLKSEQLEYAKWKQRSKKQKFYESVARLFSPLM